MKTGSLSKLDGSAASRRARLMTSTGGALVGLALALLMPSTAQAVVCSNGGQGTNPAGQDGSIGVVTPTGNETFNTACGRAPLPQATSPTQRQTTPRSVQAHRRWV